MAPLAYVFVWRATTKSVSLWTLPQAPATPFCVNHVPKPPVKKLLEVLSEEAAVEVVVALTVVDVVLGVV